MNQTQVLPKTRSLAQELHRKLSLRVLIAILAVCVISVSLHIAWSVFQHRTLQERLIDGLAHTVQTDIEHDDLISLRRTLEAFQIANAGAKFCLRLEGNIEVSDVPCSTEYKAYRIPLVETIYFVAADVPFSSSMSLTGVFFLFFTIMLSMYVASTIRTLSMHLGSDLLALEKADFSENCKFHFTELEHANIKIRDGINAKLAAVNAKAESELGQLAMQVSHDIRSPLSALNMIVTSLHDLPEEKRLIIRNATQRINDIANSLMHRNKSKFKVDTSLEKSDEPVLLSAALDSIISEKRIQYRERSDIEIVGDLYRGMTAFASINRTEFARAVSNLINNSVEAIDGRGRITIAIREYSQKVAVIISDNGRGIPPEVLKQLGGRGVTHGKEGTQSGFGLGVYQVKKMVEAAKGEFCVQSTVGVGTMVTLTFPRAANPSWFAERLVLPPNGVIASIDDDSTVHQIWHDRLRSLKESGIPFSHVSMTSTQQLEKWLSTENRSTNALFWIDYEFIGHDETGLDAIVKWKIADKAILVTSRYDDRQLLQSASSLGIRVLPKSLAPFIPIEATTA